MDRDTIDLVDAHLHFWDPTRLDYPWLAEYPALLRPRRPADLELGGASLAAAVFVEAGGTGTAGDLAEVAWIEEVAAGWPGLAGAVAGAPVDRGAEVAGHLAALAARPLIKGVRRNLQDSAHGFVVSEPVLDGVGRLAEHGFTFDVCVRHHQLPEVVELVRRVPGVLFVLDHLGKPAVRAGLLDPWRDDLSRLAGLPNVVCKLSGLTAEADPRRWTEAQVLPYLRHALAEFGPDRCLFGSDWPVSTLATTYPRWLAVVEAALADLPPAGRAAVLGGTARRVYRLR